MKKQFLLAITIMAMTTSALAADTTSTTTTTAVATVSSNTVFKPIATNGNLKVATDYLQDPLVLPYTTPRTTTQLAADEQAEVENNTFLLLNKLYKTPGNFQAAGVMYWEGSQLHLAIKTPGQLPKIAKLLNQSKNNLVKNHVILESTRYSQVDYDKLTERFTKFYNSKTKTGKVIDSYPLIKDNVLVIRVTEEYPYMKDSITTEFGNRLRVVVPALTKAAHNQ